MGDGRWDALKYATICSRQRCLPKWQVESAECGAERLSFDYKLMSCLQGADAPRHPFKPTQTKCQKMPLIRLQFVVGWILDSTVAAAIAAICAGIGSR